MEVIRDRHKMPLPSRKEIPLMKQAALRQIPLPSRRDIPLPKQATTFEDNSSNKFKPDHGEKPWKDGYYYRNIMGRDIPFKAVRT